MRYGVCGVCGLTKDQPDKKVVTAQPAEKKTQKKRAKKTMTVAVQTEATAQAVDPTKKKDPVLWAVKSVKTFYTMSPESAGAKEDVAKRIAEGENGDTYQIESVTLVDAGTAKLLREHGIVQ